MYQAKGIIAAMVTPMQANEKINEAELRNQVDRMVRAGIHQLFCLGTNGEFYALSFDEKVEVMRIVVDQCKGRVPVCAGTGCITTEETISLSRRAMELGVDAVSVITPYFAAVSQNELKSHYTEIAARVDMPIILYNIPARTGNQLEPETVAQLSRVDNIVAVKDSSGNFDTILRYIEATDETFSVLSGNDSLILWTLLAGGKGGIAGTANLFPELLVSIYDNWRAGDPENANRLQKSLRPIRNMLKLANPNTVIKRAMNLLGYPVGPARRPVAGDPGVLDENLKKVLALYR